VTTSSATSVFATGATLQATVNPHGASTTAFFQYSTDPSFPGITTIGSGFKAPINVAVDAAGDVFVALAALRSNTGQITLGAVKEVLPDGSIKTVGSGFKAPAGVAVDAAGDVFVADAGNDAVYEVLPDGTIKTLGSGFGNPVGVAVDAAG